jgi:hypothetical protein
VTEDSLIEQEISQYFAEFNPTAKQLGRLVTLVRGVHKWYGIEYGNAVEQATLVMAPGELSQLTPAAFDLLKRCRNHIWAFKVRLEDEYGVFYKETYEKLLDSLLSLGLIAEATQRQKLKGSRTVDELRSLLEVRGLPTKGKKDVLVNRIIECSSQAELDALVTDVILFRTTEEGDYAIQLIGELRWRVQKAFASAAIGTMRYFKDKQSPPTLPPGVLYDDGEVRITEEEVKQAAAELDLLLRQDEQE